MTDLAQRPSAVAAPVAGRFTDPYRPPVGAVLDDPRWFEAFPAWSSLSWDERADYIAQYCG